MSSVKRVARSNVRMPRSQSITCEFPSRSTYSAAISSSSIVADGPALQEHRLVRAADLGEEREVLHVPRADLDHVGRVDDRLDVAGVHQLGHDRQARLLARLLEDLEPLLPEALERVRGRARLERAAAQHARARVLHGVRREQRLLPVLDGARPGDQAEVAVTDAPAAHVDHGRAAAGLARDELVRLEDRHHLLHAREALERQRREQLAVADHADHGRVLAGSDVSVRAGLGEARHDVVHLLGRRVRAHDDQKLWGPGDGHGSRSVVSSAMRIFSGIQPTGDKHLGNYSGGFRQYAATQEEGDAFFCIVDLHSITVDYDPAELRSSTLDLAAMLFATGLDANRSTVFIQSHVPAHTEAAWLLGSVTSYGELRRMTQFKDKGDRQDFISAGLFSYPVLQAADILLYQTEGVPVGEDQRQHIELARNIAERFNQRFGQTLTLPEMVAPSVGGRIMDLQEPERKMSTTGGTPQGTVKLLDEPDVIRKKFKTAVTDSGSEIRRADDKPGISNLIEIMSVASGKPMDDVETEFDGQGYGAFKEAVGESVVELLDPIRERHRELSADPLELQRLLAVGAEKAREASQPTLDAMLDHMGIVRSEVGRMFGAARPRDGL